MPKNINNNRRKILSAGIGLGALASIGALRPSDRGENHNRYFSDMSKALHRARLSKPTMIIDLKKFQQNITNLSQSIGNEYDYRIVGKSLPSIPLLQTVMTASNSNRLMMFHQPFLNEVAIKLPQSDVLMGKPMPVVAADNFYREHKVESDFDPAKQLQWLLDTPQRLRQYQQLAQERNIKMRINIELDVGLHRGGINNDQQLIEMLDLIEADSSLTLSGFMGYEPHVAKVPGNKLAARDDAMKIYQDRLSTAETHLGRDLSQLTLNGAGSPTFGYYQGNKFPLNELSAGSCLVKPSDFDLPTLTDYVPAAFIATPVIKSLDNTELPGPKGVASLMTLWNPNRKKAVFTYGGYWKAKPESPAGLSVNPLFGRSTNQEMYNCSKSVNLAADDWVFFRPTQSESVFLQFEDIAVYDEGEIVDFWPVLNSSHW